MPQVQDRALTDPELLSVFNNPKADLSLLSREERNRLVTLTEPKSQTISPVSPVEPGTWLGGAAKGFMEGATNSLPGQVIRGTAAGLKSTIYHGGDLIRRGVGMKRVIDKPAVQAAMTPPDTVAGKIGFYGEQGAEFAAPLMRLSRAVKGLPFLARTAVDAAGAAGTVGVQSGGDTGQTIGAGVVGAALPVAGVALRPVFRGAQRAAAAASEGGIGGAIAAGVRRVAPSEPRTLLVQAIKPRATLTQFPATLDRAIPEIKSAEAMIGKPITGIESLLEATKAAKKSIQQQLNQLRGSQRAIGAEIDLSSVADAMTRSIPKKVILETPDVATRLAATADAYRRPFTLDEAEVLLRETNAELDGFYAMYPQARRSALTSNPGTAALEAQAKALRDAIYTKLDAPGQGAAARELNRRYGSLMEVEGEAFRRSNVAARQQPESLSEQIGAVRAAGEYARGTWRILHGDLTGAADIAAAQAGRSTAKAIKDSQTTDALIRRAFAGYRGHSLPVTMPPNRPVRGLLPSGPIITPPPADPSFVRGVPAVPAVSGRPRQLPASTAHVTPPPADISGGAGVRARSVVVRDPKTGRMKRMYTSEAK